MAQVTAQPQRYQPGASGGVPIPVKRRARRTGDGGNLGRLRRTRVILAVAAVLFGAAGAWTVQQRTAGAHDAATHSGPLAIQSVTLYRALSDADATAATAYLSAGQEPVATRHQYDTDLTGATAALTAVAAQANGAKDIAPSLATINSLLPEYVGRIEQARANNLLGYPIGARYLNLASGEMQTKILPAAKQIADVEAANLLAAQDKATAVPYVEVAAVVLILGFLLVVQARESRRTNRVVNAGLLGATLGVVLSVVWMAGAFAVEQSQVGKAKTDGSDQVAVLARAQIESLQARSDEMLTLVGHGAAPDKEIAYQGLEPQLATAIGGVPVLAGGSSGNAATGANQAATDEAAWNKAHVALRKLDTQDNKYADAVDNAINGDANKAFVALQADLKAATDTTQAAFLSHSTSAEHALSALEIGLAVIGLAMAAAAIAGLGRRISEYR